MLGQIVADANTPLAALQLAPVRPQRAEPLHAHPFSPVGARIAERARMQPHAHALHCEGEHLNYGELDAWSARIARTLQT
ncbi:hypothetical protein, partial [Burkholderia sp. SIMBA_062]